MPPLAHQHNHSVRLADAAANAVDRAVLRLWKEVLALLRDAPTLGAARLHQRATVLFRRLRPAATEGLRTGLMDLVQWTRRATVRKLVRSVPVQVLQRVAVRRNRVLVPQLESVQRVTEDAAGLLALYYNARGQLDFTSLMTALAAGEQRDLFERLLFPPPPEWLTRQRIDRLIAPFLAAPRPDLVPPEQLANVLVQRYSQGATQQEIARELLPHVDGVKASARRVARTWGIAAANDEQLAVHERLSDVIIGYTIHSARKKNSRPEHVRRDGTQYFRNPESGQLGFDSMPRPPREADGTLAWNCLCWLAPIFAEIGE